MKVVETNARKLREVMETKAHLIAVLLRHGRVRLAELLDVSEASIAKKINGEEGWKLDQLSKAFDMVGAQVIPGDQEIVIIPKNEWMALRLLAKKSLERDEL